MFAHKCSQQLCFRSSCRRSSLNQSENRLRPEFQRARRALVWESTMKLKQPLLLASCELWSSGEALWHWLSHSSLILGMPMMLRVTENKEDICFEVLAILMSSPTTLIATSLSCLRGELADQKEGLLAQGTCKYQSLPGSGHY